MAKQAAAAFDEFLEAQGREEPDNVICVPLPEDRPKEVDGLGKPKASALYRAANKPLNWLLAATGLLIGGFLTFAGIVLPLIPTREGINRGTGGEFVVAFGLAGLLFGGWRGFLAVWSKDRTFWACPRGLVWQKRGVVSFCRWEELDRFIVNHALLGRRGVGGQFVPLRELHQYTLEAQGERFKFDNTRGRWEQHFGDLCEELVTRAMLPRRAEAFERGEALSFDPFTLRREGLGYRDERSPWQDVTDVRLEKGVLTVLLRSGQTWRAPYNQMNFALACLVLLRVMVVQTHGGTPGGKVPADDPLAPQDAAGGPGRV
jgi:hypothetical protein